MPITLARARWLASIAVLAVAGCQPVAGSGSGAMSPPRSPHVTLYAAASLNVAIGRAVAAYTVANPGTTISVSTDSSAALETKIEQGAPADLFLSADTMNPQKLVDRGLAAGAVVPFAANRLTIIVPQGNPAHVASPADLARASLKVIAAAPSVPITAYANRLVANLSRLAGYPATFAASYEANVVSREDNVAAVVAKIELGEGDAAIVYATDAMASNRVDTIQVPDAANVVARYGGVVVRASPMPDAAGRFLQWLAGPGGRAVLASLGFLPPS